MEVKTSASPVLGLVEAYVVLHCNFTLWQSVKKEDVAVKWTMKTVSGEVKPVYEFDGTLIKGYRHESYVNTELLPVGVASLTLSHVMPRDEGIYTCTILVPPQYGHGKIQLIVRGTMHLFIYSEYFCANFSDSCSRWLTIKAI